MRRFVTIRSSPTPGVSGPVAVAMRWRSRVEAFGEGGAWKSAGGGRREDDWYVLGVGLGRGRTLVTGVGEVGDGGRGVSGELGEWILLDAGGLRSMKSSPG